MLEIFILINILYLNGSVLTSPRDGSVVVVDWREEKNGHVIRGVKKHNSYLQNKMSLNKRVGENSPKNRPK